MSLPVCVCDSMGLAGSSKLDRNILMLVRSRLLCHPHGTCGQFFISEMWILAGMTRYLYDAVNEYQSQDLMCYQTPLLPRFHVSPEDAVAACDFSRLLAMTKMGLAVSGIPASVGAA